MLEEARRLFKLGLGVHWIKPNSKAPVKTGWSGGERDDWPTVKKDYRPGYGLGVRLGEPSHVDGGFLANIDVDVKSADPRHKKEALKLLDLKFPGLRGAAPLVKTGHGLRYFVRTVEPTQSGKLGASNEETIVKLPTAEVNRRQELAVAEGKMTAKQLAEGYRVRPAWELEFMSAGKQVVLPPSIHPETKKPYIWSRRLELVEAMPLVAAELIGVMGRTRKAHVGLVGFEPVVVDLTALPDRIIDMILAGTGVGDRSAAMFVVCREMHNAGYSDVEILSVLTDRSTFLGEVAYEKGHRNTDSRASAAAWVHDFTLRKVIDEVSASAVFAATAVVDEDLDEAAAEAQQIELVGERDWRQRIKRRGKEGGGAVVASLENTVLVLENAVSFEVFRHNLFSSRDTYGIDTPWGGKEGMPLADPDLAQIALWLGENFHFEPNVSVIVNAIAVISRRNAFHPVRDELNALAPWDGVPRLDTWLVKHFQAKGLPAYTADVFRKWLVGSVKRVFEPGAKFDWIPIFQGMQGTGKSSFGRILFGDKYFTDWLPTLSDKDAAFGLQGIRCVEFGELASLGKQELEVTKAFLTRMVDKARPVYGRLWVDLPRQCVFFGTTNLDTYLKDDSGNRRFNPLEVGWLDFDALVRDRDQLWAEALFIYRNELEPCLELRGEVEAYARTVQAEKMVADDAEFMVERLQKFVEMERQKPKKDRFDFAKFKLVWLFSESIGPLGKYQENARNHQFAAKALKKIGAEKYSSMGVNWWRIK